MSSESKINKKRFEMKKHFSILYFMVTGLITIPLAIWFSAGTIAESQSDFPEPKFLGLIVIWLLGLVISLYSKLYWLAIIISFLPVAYFIFLFVYPNFM